MKVFDSFSKKISGRSMCCLEVFTAGSERKYVFQAYSVEQQKISILTTEISGDLNTITTGRFKNLPVILLLTGDQIISKSVQNSEGEDHEKLFTAAFPSISRKDFNYQYWKIKNSRGYLSIIRREFLENEISSLKRIFPNVLRVFLGNSCVYSLQSLIPDGTTVNLPSGKILFGSDFAITSINNSPQTDDISPDVLGVGKEALLVLGAATADVMGYRPANSSDSILAEIETEASSRQKLKTTTTIVIVVVLIVSVVNAIVFQQYFGKVEKSRSELSVLRQKEAQFAAAAKKYGISSTGGSTLLNTHFGYYSDRIASTIPQGIKLSELDINPENDHSKGIDDLKKEIKIAGVCENSTQLSKWIDDLKKLQFLQSVSLKKFRMTGPGTSGFELSLLPVAR